MAGWDTALSQDEAWRNYISSHSAAQTNGSFSSPINALATTLSGPSAAGLYGYMPNQAYYTDQGQANAVLERLRQFDPNAALQTTVDQANEGPATTRYGFNFDQSKLPQMPTGFTSVLPRNMGYFNHDMVVSDPNYGAITPVQNQYVPSQRSWIDIVGPLLVGGFAGLGAGGFSALNSLLTKLPNVASTLGGAGAASPTATGGITPQQLAIMRLLSQNRG